MPAMKARFTASRILLTAAIIACACLVNAGRAGASETIVVRGEMARLLRQAYDYHYRNSNNNVFRSSNHYHPTKNIFRSSNHYKRRLAASLDGYPLRTIVRYTSHHDGEPRERVYSFAHHRRHPYGPGWAPGISNGGLARILLEEEEAGAERFDAQEPAPQPPPRKKPRSRREIETVPVHIIEREPTQRAVMKTVSLPQGGTKTIITSVPIEPRLDEAWQRLTRGEHEEAARCFAARSLDETDGPEATLGYGLARALAGDDDDAARAIRRALDEDPEVAAKLTVDPALRVVIERIVERIETNPAPGMRSEPDAADAVTVIGDACRALLDGDAASSSAAD
ncbi:MAG: hypothetical protein SYC29_03705 [Planctomycetota bacterium]|nr:hypothetical protein [Planctomycetota bacterium]